MRYKHPYFLLIALGIISPVWLDASAQYGQPGQTPSASQSSDAGAPTTMAQKKVSGTIVQVDNTVGALTIKKMKITVYTALSVWFAIVLALALVRALQDIPSAILLAAGFVIPASAFFICYFLFPRFRRFVLSQRLPQVTLLQASRITGVIFFIEWMRGNLPAEFAIPTGISDMTVGISAPVVASMVNQRAAGTEFVVWHIFGILGLIVSGTMGILTSPPPLGILAHGVTSQAMADFPLVLVPTFLGPVILILHLIALCIVLDHKASRRVPRVAAR